MNNRYKIYLFVLCLLGFYHSNAQTELTFYTSMGNFKVMLTDALTPRTVDSFKARVSRKFYDGLLFHRVIDNFVIQGGDPLGNGSGGPGYTTPDEFSPTLKNDSGTLAMANSGPNTNGSQFYVNLVNNNSLNNHYTVFGKVTSGFSIVKSIGHVATDGNNRPITNVYTDSIRITNTPTSVFNVQKEISANIYPNPCHGHFSIALPSTVTKVEVMNLQGQLLYSSSAKDLLNVDLQEQPAGLYVVKMSNEHGALVRQLVMQ